MSRFSRIAIAILIAAVSLFGLGYLVDNNRIPDPIARILSVSPANGQLLVTATPTTTNQPTATATTVSVTASPTVTIQDAVATTSPSPTITVTITAQSTPTPTETTITSTVELVGPDTFRINSAKPISLTLWLTTNKGVMPGVTADIFGLTSAADRTFWPVHLRSQKPVTVRAGSVVSSVITPTNSGEKLPPFGTYTGTLRLNVAPPGVSKLQAITLNIVPSNQQAEMLVDLADPVHVQGGEPIKLVIGSGYTETTNVQARITQLLDGASESVPVGFIGVSDPVTIAEGSSDELSLTVDAVGLRRALRAGESYTATLVLTADNAPLITRKMRLQVAGPKAWWRLETPRVTPQFAGEDTVTFDLWFTSQGIVVDTNDRESMLALISMLDSDGRSILPTSIGITQLPTPSTPNDPNGLPSVGSRFTLTLKPEDPLRHGVYTGTVQLAMDDTIQPVTFVLEVPQRDLALSLPEPPGDTPLVNLGYTRIIPIFPWFWRTNSDTLYLAPETGLTRLADLAIPPANLVGSSGGLGQITFATPTTSATNQSTDETGFPVVLSLSGIRSTGVYTGVTEIRSPDLESPKALEVTITVTDLIIWPILFIFLGVVTSAWVAGRLNPDTNPDYQQLLNEEMRREINRLQREFNKEEGNADMDAVTREANRLLDVSTQHLRDRRMGDATAARKNAENELEKLRKFNQIKDLRKRNVDEKPETFEEIRMLLVSAWALTVDGRLTEAAAKISEARAKLDEALSIRKKAERAVGEPEVLAAMPSLAQAQRDLDAGHYRAVLSKARLAMRMAAKDREQTTITVECTTPEDFRATGEMLEFCVVQDEPMPEGTKYSWYVDDQPLENCRSDKCDYVFCIARNGAVGSHAIRVEIVEPDGSEHKPPACQVEIRQPTFRIGMAEPEPRAEREVAFQLERESQFGYVPVLDPELHCDWRVVKKIQNRSSEYLPSGTAPLTHSRKQKTTWSWTFDEAGSYDLECTVKVASSGDEIDKVERNISVDRSLLDAARKKYRLNQRLAAFGTAAIATLTGVAYVVFFRPTFGTSQDYVLAFLWGAGVDVLGRGLPAAVSPVFRRFTDWLRGTRPQGSHDPQADPAKGGK